MNKADKLNKIVDEMAICDDAKDEVRKLLGELGYEVTVEDKPKMKAGQVWQNNYHNCNGTIFLLIKPYGMLGAIKNDKHRSLLGITLTGLGYGYDFGSTNDYKFIAESLEEYYKQKLTTGDIK